MWVLPLKDMWICLSFYEYVPVLLCGYACIRTESVSVCVPSPSTCIFVCLWVPLSDFVSTSDGVLVSARSVHVCL